MNSSLIFVATFLLLVVVQQASSATEIECYTCSGVGEDDAHGCGSGAKFNGEGSGVLKIKCASGACVKNTVENNGQKVYTRQCGSASAGSQCTSVLGISSCYDTCTTALCNDSPAVRYTLLSLVSSALVFFTVSHIFAN